jgi:hypothetical protein
LMSFKFHLFTIYLSLKIYSNTLLNNAIPSKKPCMPLTYVTIPLLNSNSNDNL